MTELKTLKDLVTYDYGWNGEEESRTAGEVSVSDLRLEAIKWVRDLRERRPMKMILRSKTLEHGQTYIDAQIEFIEEFFDLSAEDLK